MAYDANIKAKSSFDTFWLFQMNWFDYSIQMEYAPYYHLVQYGTQTLRTLAEIARIFASGGYIAECLLSLGSSNHHVLIKVYYNSH